MSDKTTTCLEQDVKSFEDATAMLASSQSHGIEDISL